MVVDKVTDFVLTEKDMKNLGYKVVDAVVAHFINQDEALPVGDMESRKEAGEKLDAETPEEGKPIADVMHFVIEEVLKKSNIVSHPKSYAFVPGPANYISVLADQLATGFNVFSGGWMASPSAAMIEITTMNWLLKLFGLPVKSGGGIFTSGGSMANLTALATARNVKIAGDFSKSIIYLSDQAHSSNVKAIRVLGFRKEQIRIIPTDITFKIAFNKLQNAIAKDRLEGLNPFCIIASAGTTNTGTVDPLEELAAIAKKENLWLHVDAAYGGAAILTSAGKKMMKGIEKADSITVDPHKWFYQPYEIGCLLVRNHKWLSGTFTEKPEYLRDIEGNKSEINFYDHGIELTRRFRALKLFMSIKTYGMKTFREAVQYNMSLAEEMEEHLRNSNKWEVVSPATLAIINFRYNPIMSAFSEDQLDGINQTIADKILASKEALLVTTVLNGQIVLRMCLINPRTTMNHLIETLDLCETFAEN